MNNIITTKLGERIRDLRKGKFLTQEILGERAMVSYKFVGEIERGDANPSISVLIRIATALEVSLSDLFTFPDDGQGKGIFPYRKSRLHGPFVQDALKWLIPSKDIKKQCQLLKALKLLRSALGT
jgi:transcriptional regulator with XRE-family HTH domain